jgi:hypothetical protein
VAGDGEVGVVNEFAVCEEVFQGVTDSDMNVEAVSGVNASAVGTTDDCDGGGYSMGSGCPNEALRGREVGKNDHVGTGCCPTDFSCLSGVQTGRADRV